MAVKVQHWKGAWWVIIHHAGRRKTKRIGDKETALRVAEAIRERLARTDLQLGPREATPILRTYAEKWLETADETLKASTVALYRANLERYILPALASRGGWIAAPRGLPRLGHTMPQQRTEGVNGSRHRAHAEHHPVSGGRRRTVAGESRASPRPV